MTTTTKKPSLVCRLLNRIPTQGKRMIVLASLCQGLATTAHADEALTSIRGDLVTQMKLSSSSESLELPGLWWESIWNAKSQSVRELIDSLASRDANRESVAAEQLSQRIPEWLRYANTREIAGDIQRLVAIVKRHV